MISDLAGQRRGLRPFIPFPLQRLGRWASDHGLAISYSVTAGASVLFAIVVFSLPFQAYLSFLNLDDSFYYDQIARNFAAGRFSTFDGLHLTNGYHPLWAAVLTAVFAFVHDPFLAIRVAKMVELAMLLAAALLIMASGRKAGWPVLLTLVVPISLFGAPILYQGMETSIQVLLCAGLLYCLVDVFVGDDRPLATLGLGLICCLLPWARLETLSISLLTLSAVSLHALRTRVRRGRAILIGWMLLVVSVAGYFVYNKAIFDLPIPVSGAIKNYWSTLRFSEEGGYNLASNARRYYWAQRGYLTECGAIFSIMALPWLFSAYRKARYAPLQSLDLFIIILIVAYVARLAYASLFVHWSYDNLYYYVPYYVLHALAPAYLVSRILLMVDLLAADARGVRFPASLAASGAALLVVALQAHPWSLPARWGRPAPTWLEASYDGANWMNRSLPAGAVVGSPDSGVVGYFTQRRVINLDGLVNDAGFFTAVRGQSVEEWIRKAGITHLANAVPADTAESCGSVAAGSAQTRPYSGSCRLLYGGVRFHQGWRSKLNPMQFRIYAYTPKTAAGPSLAKSIQPQPADPRRRSGASSIN